MKKERERERDVSYHSNKSSFIELLEVAMLVGNNITLHTIKGATCLALGDITTFIFSFFSDECQDEKSKSTAVRAFLLRHFFSGGQANGDQMVKEEEERKKEKKVMEGVRRGIA
jgi:hypothetical protein